MNKPRLWAAATTVLFLSACEKPAGPEGTPAATVAVAPSAASEPLVSSALPAQPSLADPVFGPEFVDRAGGSNLFAIAEAKLALTRSNRPDVKAFASAMIDAHTKSNASLQAAVDASGETTELPTALSDDFQARYSALTRVAAGGFDKAYLVDQVGAHQDSLDGMRIYARRGDTPALKKFAADAASVIEAHLASAKTLQASLP